MQVLFECRDPEGARMRAFAERRARFVMRRLTWLAPRVRIHLVDVNGPAGGTDKRCRVEVLPPGGTPVVVTSLARDWRGALDAALGRASHALLRAWRRMRKPGRSHGYNRRFRHA